MSRRSWSRGSVSLGDCRAGSESFRESSVRWDKTRKPNTTTSRLAMHEAPWLDVDERSGNVSLWADWIACKKTVRPRRQARESQQGPYAAGQQALAVGDWVRTEGDRVCGVKSLDSSPHDAPPPAPPIPPGKENPETGRSRNLWTGEGGRGGV